MTSNSDSPPPPPPPPAAPVSPARELARQEAEFTSEGAPAPGQVAGTEQPALPDPDPAAAPPPPPPPPPSRPAG